MSNASKSPELWRTRATASEEKGVPIPSSHSPCQVIDRLYISNMLTASLFLKGIAPAYCQAAPQITHILSIVSGRSWQLEVIQKINECQIIQKKVILRDVPDANLMEHFPEICSFIHSALALPNTQVLVHCYAGISRSASAIVAYLIWARHLSYEDAIKLVRYRRPEANPNPGFCKQLRAWHEMDCELLDDEDLPKEWYAWTCRTLQLKKHNPNLLALRRFQRPPMDGKRFLKQSLT